VLYCHAGENQWHMGFSENISESGAIIRSGEARPPRSRVTIVIALPSSDVTPGGVLIGKGTVVRSADVSPTAPGSTFAVMAAFALSRRKDLPDLTSN
jgi:hypothetical protein